MTVSVVHLGAKTQSLLSPNPINFDLNMNNNIMAHLVPPVNCYLW
jgi:hypothetical protein